MTCANAWRCYFPLRLYLELQRWHHGSSDNNGFNNIRCIMIDKSSTLTVISMVCCCVLALSIHLYGEPLPNMQQMHSRLHVVWWWRYKTLIWVLLVVTRAYCAVSWGGGLHPYQALKHSSDIQTTGYKIYSSMFKILISSKEGQFQKGLREKEVSRLSFRCKWSERDFLFQWGCYVTSA